MPKLHIDELSKKLATVAPVVGLSSDGRIDFEKDATKKQIAAAEAILKEEFPTMIPYHAPTKEPTKAELLAQVKALAAKIEAMS